MSSTPGGAPGGDGEGEKDEEELASNVVGIYRRHARAFDAQRSRALFERGWLERFFVALPEARDVLDLGCGMGEPIAGYLIEKGCRLTGLDTSPALLALARERFPHAEWIQGDMRELALARRFAGILAWGSFFFLTPGAQRKMFARFAGHLRPGGALLFTAGPEAGARIGTFEGEKLYHASLAPEEYRDLLAENGFEVVRYVPEDPECGGYTVWLARLAS
ncbi:class I SAM-dependent methyltransferase [Afifella sp. IM 167]|uniref:class I SAM-dependent DNA methyltransferase n=1 Tax=Afifella sp. IM 167 TaxID=2033586 RepID=UPI001CC974F2|nr:SAM-dependent methyltransferase [Afifella sp. IM 167]